MDKNVLQEIESAIIKHTVKIVKATAQGCFNMFQTLQRSVASTFASEIAQ
jgi:hypothetical protein